MSLPDLGVTPRSKAAANKPSLRKKMYLRNGAGTVNKLMCFFTHLITPCGVVKLAIRWCTTTASGQTNYSKQIGRVERDGLPSTVCLPPSLLPTLRGLARCLPSSFALGPSSLFHGGSHGCADAIATAPAIARVSVRPPCCAQLRQCPAMEY